MNGDQKSDVYAQGKQDFIQHFSQIVRVLTEDEMGYSETGDAIAQLKEVLEYNAIGGKYHQGLTVLVASRELVEPRKQDADSLQRALTMGWFVELLQAFFLVADDIMDSSLSPQGQIWWYQKPSMGLDAINDAMLPEAWQWGGVGLGRFTEKRYKSIVKYKAAFYSYLPVAAAMYIAGIDGEKNHANAKKILLDMGEFFQIQDDYLDLFGDPSVTSKVGADIQDNKCSWLVVQRLQQATPEQYQILKKNYGQKEAKKVAQVKALYEELDLPAVGLQYEEDSYSHIMGLIEQYAAPLTPAIFLGLLRKIYKQKK
ncbi:hypothetical protein EGM_18703 [Macaca fascicularis]|uniref:Farnesyl pyrophosphate synthase n=1 Tax=Macaca fascicularis TaxID=9541 RepID=G7Q2J9_MACFA|nr:hypothetical protein EGM_18703 [Macaca fascicularis]